jgi:hypothetical protein
MSEPIPACLSIGGPISRRFVQPLCQAIANAGVSLDWGDARFRPHSGDDLLDACREEDGKVVLLLCDDEAN